MMHSDVRPYLMDLGSANGTYLNNERIEPERYYELLEKAGRRFCLHLILQLTVSCCILLQWLKHPTKLLFT